MTQNILTLSYSNEFTKKKNPKEIETETVNHLHMWNIRMIPYCFTIIFGIIYNRTIFTIF